MSIVDLLIMIIVVTILVTIVLGVVTYLAYKLRRVRMPEAEDEADPASWCFVRHIPEGQPAEEV